MLLQRFSKLAAIIPAAFLFSSIYSINITSSTGTTISLSQYQGKKILVAVLPATQNAQNQAFLQGLDSLCDAQGSSMAVIAVPAFEFGYTAAQSQILLTWYQGILNASNVVITSGMYVRKSSGSQQHALFEWLTRKENNDHFDQDCTGAGYKFIIKANGDLFAVLGPEMSIGSGGLRRILQAQ